MEKAMQAFYRTLRILSAVTLFFFCWTFLPLWQAAAWAAEPQGQKPAGKGQGSVAAADPSRSPLGKGGCRGVGETSGDRFEKALEDIRDNVARVEKKHTKGEDDTVEREHIRAKKIEIDSLDVEFKKEFAATEKKLRDAKLPQEIVDRHAKFVKHYEDNLRELKTNLSRIEDTGLKADKLARRQALQAAKAHLEKTKAASKHVPLDPNKLPFRTVKGKERAPRLKKEEFEKEFGPQKKQQTTKTAGLWDVDERGWTRILNSAFRTPHAAIQHRPILLASNATIASDMPLELPRSSRGDSWGEGISWLPEFAFSGDLSATNYDPRTVVLAQTTGDLPTAADLSETPEVQFTPAIRTKAQDELGCNPTNIYNWVRNNIQYVPYYGSFKNAGQTLLEGAGNDIDQASLLIGLMRVCNIAAKYSYGTVEIPAEKAANMVGVSDARAAATILATQGIPAKLVITGGTVKAIQLERVWVDAWIDYFPSWGARHKPGGEDTWIPLDPSFKQYTYKQGMDMYALMGFNAEEFLTSYITDTLDIIAYQDYSRRMTSYLTAHNPNATIEDIFGADDIEQTKTIIKQEFPYLLGTLPYKVVVKAAQFDVVPGAINYTVAIQIEGDPMAMTTGLSYTGSLNYFADKRTTVSYVPATPADEAVVARYDGNLLSVPPYLITVKPVLRVNGSVVATGAPVGLGQEQNIVISFAGPDGDRDRIKNSISAGVYAAIILQSQNTSLAAPSNSMARLTENAKNLGSPDIILDDLLGQMLYSIGVSYFHSISFENKLYTKTLQLINLRQPSEAMVTHGIKVSSLFGVPRYVSEGSINIDVDRNMNVVVSPTQDNERVKAFMILSGLSSSAWENRILEAFFNIPSVSASRLLKLASEQGIPVYTVDSTNLNELLPQLQIGPEVKTDIANAVHAGNNVIISKSGITYNQWSGVGYVVMNPTTGAAGYMISGGLAGGGTSTPSNLILRDKASFIEKVIGAVKRTVVVLYALTKLGTIYDFGCTQGGLDCSGLTYRSYRFAGEKDFPEGAENQYSYVSQHNGFVDNPSYGDIVFFHATFDSNRDGVVNNDDKSHAGIYVNSGMYSAAQNSRGTNVYWYVQDLVNGSWAQDHLDAFGIVIP